MPPTLYILYNATSTPLGKLDYAYRKLTSPSSQSPCSACDLTHGGLRLTETKEWSATKKRIPADVQQLHRDEASQEVCPLCSILCLEGWMLCWNGGWLTKAGEGQILEFVKANGVRWPCVLGREGEGEGLRLVVDAEGLRECRGDHERFLERLVAGARGVGISLDVERRGEGVAG